MVETALMGTIDRNRFGEFYLEMKMGVEQSDFLRAFERLDEMKVELKLNSQIV